MKKPILKYCFFCGNIRIEQHLLCCPQCALVLNGKLSRAYLFYLKVQEANHQCCGGLSWNKDHLHFHGKYWNGSYGDEPLSIGVEFGVSFYEDHAQTYWIFDDDSTTEGMYYGDKILYDDPDFMEKLDKQLDSAPEVAWNMDFLSCDECGNHYYVGNGPCHCQKRKETING